MRIGAQLYTARDSCKTLEGFADTLKKVADIGYKTVQVSGTCAYEAEWLKEQLQKNGLACPLTHISPAELTGNLKKVLADHEVFGCPYIGLGFWAFDEARDMTFDQFMATWPHVARAIREGGRYFMYHNHDREFIHLDGKPILAHLAERIPAEDMGFTLDTFWVQAGGGDPGEWLEILSGRVPCIHLKDCGYGRSMEALGEGNINFDRVFKKAEAAGTQYMLVEQDDCHGEDPIECLRRSYRYLASHGFD